MKVWKMLNYRLLVWYIDRLCIIFIFNQDVLLISFLLNSSRATDLNWWIPEVERFIINVFKFWFVAIKSKLKHVYCCIVLIKFTHYGENELHRSYQVYSVSWKLAASFLARLLSIAKTSCIVLIKFTQYRENEVHCSYQVYSVWRKRAASLSSNLLSMAKYREN